MEQYPVKIERELLDLGAVEMDKTLRTLLLNTDNSVNKVEFINEEGVAREFRINWEEGMLYGRGIKGFFKKYSDGHLFLEPHSKGVYKVYGPQSIDRDCILKLGVNLENTERICTVLNALSVMKKNDEKWFQLHHLMREYVIDTDEDKLICLPHLRELDMYNYQTKTVKTVINRFRGRVLLCDEVGLGKTIEAGMAMMEYIMRGMVRKILILVPPSLIDQWYYEMKRKFNQDFIRHDDPDFKKMGDSAWGHYNKVIASISTAKRQPHKQIISGIQYDLVVVDEAHHVKNRRTLAWKFVNTLKKKYIFLLTATPVQNNLEELYNLITLLKPGQLKTYTYFKKNFVEDSKGIKAKNVDQLRRLLSDVMIRNKRSDVDIKFTKRNARTLRIALSDEEMALYDEISCFIKKRYSEENTGITRLTLKTLQEQLGSCINTAVSALERLSSGKRLDTRFYEQLKDFYHRAKKIADKEYEQSSKATQLLKILKDFGDKVIIFTKYRTTLEFIVNYLKRHGIEAARFHGGMIRKEKEKQIEIFKKSLSVLVSTEVGGEGRNLQFCNGMVNYDLPWNPMAIEQRIGRIHRVGQQRDVYVYNLAAKDTVEHYILDILDKKINMFELVVGELDMILGDIEEESEFSEIVMNAWVKSDNLADMEKQMNAIGEKLLENKRQYICIKNLDDKLFGSSLKSANKEE